MNKEEEIVNFIRSLQRLTEMTLWQKIKSFCKEIYFKIKIKFLQRKGCTLHALNVGNKVRVTSITGKETEHSVITIIDNNTIQVDDGTKITF